MAAVVGPTVGAWCFGSCRVVMDMRLDECDTSCAVCEDGVWRDIRQGMQWGDLANL